MELSQDKQGYGLHTWENTFAHLCTGQHSKEQDKENMMAKFSHYSEIKKKNLPIPLDLSSWEEIGGNVYNFSIFILPLSGKFGKP